MTDTTTDHASLTAHLSPRRWMTPLEVWRTQSALPEMTVRRVLRYLAEHGAIEGRIGGSDNHPVREYRRK